MCECEQFERENQRISLRTSLEVLIFLDFIITTITSDSECVSEAEEEQFKRKVEIFGVEIEYDEQVDESSFLTLAISKCRQARCCAAAARCRGVSPATHVTTAPATETSRQQQLWHLWSVVQQQQSELKSCNK